MLTVVCWKWHDPKYRWNDTYTYTAQHVNRLWAAVREHLTLPHRFLCITDDPTGIDPRVETMPLWPDLADAGGCYRRLKAFSPAMRDLIGERFVWMDLDCVVLGSLDPLFSRPDDFIMWRNGQGPTPYCGSMVMMTAGARAQVWDSLDLDLARDLRKTEGFVGTDQAWIAHVLGRDEAVWTPRDGVLSRAHIGIHSGSLPGRPFRRNLRFREAPPAGARIIFFHGRVDPSMPAVQAAYPWIGDYWCRPAPA